MLVRARPHSHTVPGTPVGIRDDLDLSTITYVVDTVSICVKNWGDARSPGAVFKLKTILCVKDRNGDHPSYLALDILDLDEAPYDGGPL